MENFYNIDGKQLVRQYKDFLSDYHQWEQKSHAEEWILLPDNIGAYLSIDETGLTNGELYTIISNKAAKGKKGSLIAIIEGTESKKIISILQQIPIQKRNEVKEVTLDMSSSMNKIVDICFPRARKVIDRFHIEQLANDALQEIRIKHRWKALDAENEAILDAKKNNEKYKPIVLENGDTQKQLLARSRYLLFKSRDKWTEKQRNRAKILFEKYPDLEKGYNLVQTLKTIFNKTKEKGIGYTKMAQWYRKVEESGFKSFNTVLKTFEIHYKGILNYFDNRSTNASAESFNAKIKSFRALLRGVSDKKFFMYRLTKIYG